jgi:hypothetical protein
MQQKPSKFSEGELLGLLEWSLPATWRAKFDLDGYIPTLHSRAKLIEACEAIEQSKTSMEKPQKEEGTSIQKKAKRAASKISAPPAKKQNSGSMYHCTEHGHNSTHSSSRLLDTEKSSQVSQSSPDGQENRQEKFL